MMNGIQVESPTTIITTTTTTNGNHKPCPDGDCKMSKMKNENCSSNGHDVGGLKRADRDDSPFEHSVFPDTQLGRLLDGIILSYLIKQEPRMGWAMRGACSELFLSKHPCEVVAAHQWGVSWLIMCLLPTPPFQKQMPSNFSIADAMQMAQIHDLPELIVTDITPADGISAEEKHRREALAIEKILARYPEEVGNRLISIYERYEKRECNESKFVKDCDRLDFMLTAFMLERQGFRGFYEFYQNSRMEREFHTQIVKDLAKLLIETRDRLARQGQLYPN